MCHFYNIRNVLWQYISTTLICWKKESSFITLAILMQTLQNKSQAWKRIIWNQTNKYYFNKKRHLKKTDTMIFNNFNDIAFNVAELSSNSAQILIQMQLHIEQQFFVVAEHLIFFFFWIKLLVDIWLNSVNCFVSQVADD